MNYSCFPRIPCLDKAFSFSSIITIYTEKSSKKENWFGIIEEIERALSKLLYPQNVPIDASFLRGRRSIQGDIFLKILEIWGRLFEVAFIWSITVVSIDSLKQGSLSLVPFKCLFLNANDSVLKLMLSVTSGVSLWYRPCYKNVLNYDNNKIWK